jgi:dihydroorotase
MTSWPAKILWINAGTLSIGAPADVTIYDPEEPWIVDENKFFSKGKNSPYIGMKLTGKVTHTLVGGVVKYENGELSRI